jgi:hypothetical protein
VPSERDADVAINYDSLCTLTKRLLAEADTMASSCSRLDKATAFAAASDLAAASGKSERQQPCGAASRCAWGLARSQPGGRSRSGAWGNWLQARQPAKRGAEGAARGQGGNAPGCKEAVAVADLIAEVHASIGTPRLLLSDRGGDDSSSNQSTMQT